MIDYAKLQKYRKGVRPVQPESLPAFVDRELDRIALITVSLVEALQELDARLAILEP
jgi:hypothetical protein